MEWLPKSDEPIVPQPQPASPAKAAAPIGQPLVPEPPITTYYPRAASAAEFEVRHLQDDVRTLYKRRWIAISAFVLLFVSTALYTYTRVPVYRASAGILM